MTVATLLHPLGFGLPAGIVALIVLRYADGGGGRRRRRAAAPGPIAQACRRVPATEMARRVNEQRPVPPVWPFV